MYIRYLSIFILLLFSFCSEDDNSITQTYNRPTILNVSVENENGQNMESNIVQLKLENSINEFVYDYVDEKGYARFKFRNEDLLNPDQGINISQLNIFSDEFEIYYSEDNGINLNNGLTNTKQVIINCPQIMFYWEKFDLSKSFNLSGKKILAIFGENFDYQEFIVITNYLKFCGAEVITSSYVRNLFGHKARTLVNRIYVDVVADQLLNDVDINYFDMIFLPGGQGPENILNNYPAICDLIKDAYESNLIISAICHGPILLCEANIVEGKRITGNLGIQELVIQNGGQYIPTDEADIIVDGTIITGNWPKFATIAETLAEELINQ